VGGRRRRSEKEREKEWGEKKNVKMMKGGL